jgi:hypothetical protein
MSNERKEIIWKAVPIIGAVVLCLGIVGFLVVSPRQEDVTVQEIIFIIGAIGGLITLIIKQLRDGGGPGTTGAAGLLLVCATMMPGCGAACETERLVRNTLSSGVRVADGLIPEDTENRLEVMSAVDGALDLGDAAVDSCFALRDGMGWQTWAQVAVDAVQGLVDLLESLGIDVPDLLEHGLDMAELLLSPE